MTRSRTFVASLVTLAVLSAFNQNVRAEDSPPASASATTATSWKAGDGWFVDRKAPEARQMAMWVMTWKELIGPTDRLSRFSLWSRYGLDPFDVRLAGQLREFTDVFRDSNNAVSDAIIDGTVPHRRARIAVLPRGHDVAFEISLVEEDGWRIVRADRVAPSERTPIDVAATVTSIELSAAATSLWKAIDNDDTKTFVAVCANWKDGALLDVEAKAVEEMLTDFHQKYGLRPRRILKPKAIEGSDEFEVPVLIGDREVLLLCGMRKDAKGAWRLVRVSDGDPASVEDEKPAEPAMGETPPVAPTPPTKDEPAPK
jgi:hypothetical protein